MKRTKLIVLSLFSSMLIFGQLAVAQDLIQKEELTPDMVDVSISVLKMPLDKGVSVRDAHMSINLKAEELNMKKVGYLPVSDELKARGLNPPHLEIFQFCNPEDAMKMVQFNTLYAAFMPCRIALVEDEKGHLWLQMINLDMIIDKYPLPEDLRKIAVTINSQMLQIITAGVKGSF
ncbi:MAG: DUF302 domain-containing protein [gamma proteobacterium symbiont of Lucinoma myriamae]|nr:DUF302 domain-containing protein [gamma proteobacterium symbiont of Lucinoma myriamae]